MRSRCSSSSSNSAHLTAVQRLPQAWGACRADAWKGLLLSLTALTMLRLALQLWPALEGLGKWAEPPLVRGTWSFSDRPTPTRRSFPYSHCSRACLTHPIREVLQALSRAPCKAVRLWGCSGVANHSNGCGRAGAGSGQKGCGQGNEAPPLAAGGQGVSH